MINGKRFGERRNNWKIYYFRISTLMWVIIWFGIDTGPWVFRHEPVGLIGWLHCLRTACPFVILLIAWGIGKSEGKSAGVLSGPVKLWLIYGLIGLGACVFSPVPEDAAYWALVYLSAFAAMQAYIREPKALERALRLNHLSWIVTTVFLAILVFIARDVLFVTIGNDLTGYGIVGRIKTAGTVAMSRSSGMARFAAVPGVVAFVYLWRGTQRLLWLGVFAFSASLIYFMQSRGAIFGLGFAMAFTMLFIGVRERKIGIVFMLLFGLLLFTNVIPESMIQKVENHLKRGQNEEELRSMTGRTRAWQNGWREAQKSPLIGRGFQADRYLIGEHVHNTYIYALMTSGFSGMLLFVAGLGWAWLLFFKTLRNGIADKLGQKVTFIQVGGIIAFFTVRSIPEVCGAMFGVDLMVMLPALAYLEILGRYARGPSENKLFSERP